MTGSVFARRASAARVGAVIVAAVLFAFGCADDATDPSSGGEAAETSQAQASAAATSAAPTSTSVPPASDRAAPTTTQPESPVATTQAPDDTSPPETSVAEDEAEAEGGTAGAEDRSGDESAASDAATATEEARADDENGEAAESDEAEPEPTVEAEPFAPARWDHDEIAALFSHCPPPWEDSVSRGWDRYFDDLDAGFENWADDVPRDPWDSRTPSGWLVPGPVRTPDVNRRISADGYDRTEDADYAWRWLTDEGIVPHRPVEGYDPDPDLTQQSGDVVLRAAGLLFEWTAYRYQFPPTRDEPAAWAMRTLLKTSSPSCVAVTMLNACSRSDLTHPVLQNPHLRYDANSSSVGRALWSIVCGQAPTDEKLGTDN